MTPGTASWLPTVITNKIYPAGTQKLNPDAVKMLTGQDLQIVQKAETIGAAHAFRWVATLPMVLVVVFGLIAISDKLRGGYKPVHIESGVAEEGGHP